MDCARVDGELVAFELAALDGATRAAVETHLTGCARCVSAYLALKRAIDAGEEATAPSELMRARIRNEAAAALAPAKPTKTKAAARGSRRATWAIVATAAAAALIAPLVYRATRATTPSSRTVSAPDVPMPNVTPVTTNPTVDTARTTPENLAFL